MCTGRAEAVRTCAAAGRGDDDHVTGSHRAGEPHEASAESAGCRTWGSGGPPGPTGRGRQGVETVGPNSSRTLGGVRSTVHSTTKGSLHRPTELRAATVTR